MLSLRHALSAAFAALSFVFASAAATAQADHVVISQVYGGGGGGSTSTTYTYNTDYVELYNPTTSPVSLAGMSIQYGSAAGSFGTSSSNIKVLTGTIQPGKYYLVTGSSGTAGGTLPVTADETGSFSLSATAGKVALVSNSTGNFTACTGATIVDEVSYGGNTAVSCSETSAVAALSNTTAAIRTPVGSDSNNNVGDFTVGTPLPHNSTSGGTSTTSIAVTSASASPASVMQGSASTLSVVVAPGTSSTGIAVSADLSSIGGSAAQTFALSSTANTYTYSIIVPGGASPANYTFPVTATDQQSGTASGSIALTVNAATVTSPISTIQANRSTYVGNKVQFQGVVTLVTNAGYYLQTPSTTPGSTGDEGIYVYAGSGKVPTTIAVGNLVTVNGTLTLYPDANTSHTPSLEVTNASVTSNGTAAVPTPITLPATFPTANGGIYQFQKYESMLVTVPSLTATSPTDGFLTETTETVTSSGQFYAVATGTARPFREPGMDFRDYPSTTCPSVTNCTATATSAGVARPSSVVLFDDNPERFIVETSLGGGTALDVSTGAVLKNVTGVVDFTYSTDVPYGDPARILVRPGSITSANYTPGITVQPLAVPGSNQVTVAAFNIERFFNPTASDNKYFNAGSGNVGNSSAVNVTQDAYNRRLAKLSLAIRNVLNTPDVVGVEEVENLSVLRDIARQIDTDATAAGKTAPGYVAYGTDSSSTYTNDVGGISVGFLVKPSTTNVVRWEQIGAQTTFAASTGTQTLNDRPSQVLHVGFKRAGASDYAMTLIVNHLRSLSGINTSADTRLKKELQAELLANAIQGYQAAGERVLAFGDMNAFEFSDGYTDTLGTITGSVAPAGTAAQPGKAIVSPAATNLASLLPPADRHSYVEFGNAQILDHVVATANVVSRTTLAYAHLDADFPAILTNDVTSPARVSDHDAALTYLTLPAPVVTATLTGSGTFTTSQTVGTTGAGQQFVLTNTGEGALTITRIATTGDFAQSNTCGSSLAVGATCQINVSFTPTAAGSRTGTLTVTSNATNLSAANLSGTGLPQPTFTFTAGGSPTYSVTVQRGNAAQFNLTLTPTSTFAGTVTFTCTGLPANSSCDFGTQSTITLSTNSTAQSIALLVRTATLTNRASIVRSSTEPRLAFAFWLPGLLLAGMGARSKRMHGNGRLLLFSLLLLSFAGMAGLTGCGSNAGTDYTRSTQAAAGTTTFNVVATSANVSQSIPVTLTIQ